MFSVFPTIHIAVKYGIDIYKQLASLELFINGIVMETKRLYLYDTILNVR